MNEEIILAGFGGQGILFAGKVLAYCGLIDEKEVSWLPSYGPEMRGGTANCSVCVSDEPIGSPLVLNPSLMLAMNLPSYDKFINSVKPGGKAFIDSTMVEEKSDRTDIDCFYISATQLATDNELNGMANIILLGKMIKETSLFSLETVRKAMEKSIPPRKANMLDLNMKAIEIGMNY
ncbi:MAG: 2-oxoacid:ferredoxin oxidoreductase subunit gamma [Clostridiales bacterium]|jgi:2-oxoglutarate ferredoxin oxidoreductase subunit gamma|nr:2-oxoacid:ferredoxin oxidoreductase subunit gamma [Clostridiales bacterium]